VESSPSYRPKQIPEAAGVYRFFDSQDRVLYVGKAKNLKNRLNSYFGSNVSEKTKQLVANANRVDWTIVGNEIEALQLEFTWIKSENPKYNVRFRDDKSYPYLAVDYSDEFPKIYVTRSRRNQKSKYFGPYIQSWALRSTFEALQRLFPIRSCTDSNFDFARRTKRNCLLGDIGKCSAPCVDRISVTDHRKIADDLVDFLGKDPTKLTDRIRSEMEKASSNQEFELAAKLRDQLKAIDTAFESTIGSLPSDFNLDVIAIHEEITHAAINVMNVRFGRITGSRSWIVDQTDSINVTADNSLSAFIGKYYLEHEMVSDLIVNESVSDKDNLQEFLGEKLGKSVKIENPKRGAKFDLTQMAKRNAHQSLIQFLSKRSADAAVSGSALAEIAQELNLAELPLRIECFDISNTQGTNMVASMVVFEDGQAKKSDYRRFIIDQKASGNNRIDDTAAMHQVITRRFKRYLSEQENDLKEFNELGGSKPKFAYPPQLIIVDGGKGQVSAAAAALSELGISNIALCGLAKRLEEVWLPNNPQPVMFGRKSEALYLFQRIRDEAHRFAITFHRSKRGKAMLESFLDEIPGLGQSRRDALLKHFGSVAALRKSDQNEIAKVPGIGDKLAAQIASVISSE
jgi:excinuclease ABC subunit C